MSLVNSYYTIQYKPDLEKSVEQNRKDIIAAISKMIEDFTTNDYSVDIVMQSTDNLDAEDIDNLINDIETGADVLAGIDPSPITVDEKGSPLFGLRKED